MKASLQPPPRAFCAAPGAFDFSPVLLGPFCRASSARPDMQVLAAVAQGLSPPIGGRSVHNRSIARYRGGAPRLAGSAPPRSGQGFLLLALGKLAARAAAPAAWL